jgi:hypothetical protein
MATVQFLASDGSTQSVTVNVQSGPVLPSWLNRAAAPVTTQTITGQSVSTVQSGRKYINCSFSSLELTNHSDVWIVNPVGSPYLNLKGNVKRFRCEGGEFGHRRDSGQAQIKPNPVSGTDPVPEDICFVGTRFTDNQRTSTGVHIEGLQIGGVRRLELRDCTFDRNSVMDFFARSWIGIAGIDTAPIEDILITGGTYQAPTNLVDSGSGSAAIRLNDARDSGGFFGLLRRVVITGVRSGASIQVGTNVTDTFFSGNMDLAGSPRSVQRVD